MQVVGDRQISRRLQFKDTIDAAVAAQSSSSDEIVQFARALSIRSGQLTAIVGGFAIDQSQIVGLAQATHTFNCGRDAIVIAVAFGDHARQLWHVVVRWGIVRGRVGARLTCQIDLTRITARQRHGDPADHGGKPHRVAVAPVRRCSQFTDCRTQGPSGATTTVVCSRGAYRTPRDRMRYGIGKSVKRCAVTKRCAVAARAQSANP